MSKLPRSSTEIPGKNLLEQAIECGDIFVEDSASGLEYTVTLVGLKKFASKKKNKVFDVANVQTWLAAQYLNQLGFKNAECGYVTFGYEDKADEQDGRNVNGKLPEAYGEWCRGVSSKGNSSRYTGEELITILEGLIEKEDTGKQ